MALVGLLVDNDLASTTTWLSHEWLYGETSVSLLPVLVIKLSLSFCQSKLNFVQTWVKINLAMNIYLWKDILSEIKQFVSYCELSFPPPSLPSLPPLPLLSGTDATHAEHIETIKNRNYVGVQPDGSFMPGELGMGLVEGEVAAWGTGNGTGGR